VIHRQRRFSNGLGELGGKAAAKGKRDREVAEEREVDAFLKMEFGRGYETEPPARKEGGKGPRK